MPGLGPPYLEAMEVCGNDRGWKHPRVPAVRKLWRGGATGAVLEFLDDTSAGRRLSAGVVRAPRVDGAGEGEVPEDEEGGIGPP